MFANISAIVEFLPAALAAFLAKHPDIHIHLEEHVSTGVAAAVVDNLADFGIMGSLAAVDGLTMTPFRNGALVVVLKPDHALAQRSALCFGEIAQLPLVGLHANSNPALGAGSTGGHPRHRSSFAAGRPLDRPDGRPRQRLRSHLRL